MEHMENSGKIKHTENGSIIQALKNPKLYPDPITRFEVIETHLSWVLLTGPYAYKIKKPVDLKFADFSTLEKRRFYCLEEFRLNQRLAPSLYLEVLAIQDLNAELCLTRWDDENLTSSLKTPVIIDYAIKMKQFDQNQLLSNLAEKKALTHTVLQKIANLLANFHKTAPLAPASSPFGENPAIEEPMLDNFRDCRALLTQSDIPAGILLDFLEKESKAKWAKLQALFKKRKTEGFIRECHGDCHLGNMVLIDNEPLIFDCIEFNEAFRFIDTINEVAFLTMDLELRSSVEDAFIFLNAYLEKTGDYEGLALLRFYQIYRAMIRAKVTLLSKKSNGYEEFIKYLELAKSFLQKPRPQLIITYGVSGSGKTWASTQIASKIPAIHIRSDIERKRMNLPETERYSAQAHQKVYQHLYDISEQILKAGYSLIVDATFLEFQERQQFKNLAKKLKIPFLILQCEAPFNILKENVQKRLTEKQNASEATLAVLENQLKTQEPLREDELSDRLLFRSSVSKIEELLNQIAC